MTRWSDGPRQRCTRCGKVGARIVVFGGYSHHRCLEPWERLSRKPLSAPQLKVLEALLKTPAQKGVYYKVTATLKALHARGFVGFVDYGVSKGDWKGAHVVLREAGKHALKEDSRSSLWKSRRSGS